MWLRSISQVDSCNATEDHAKGEISHVMPFHHPSLLLKGY